MAKHRPTQEAYGELRKAYDFYNKELFGGRLPRCLITMQRNKNTYGYFSGDRWANSGDDDMADEIALNPAHFATRSVEEVLSTLVHEMVHLQQHHFGKPGRGRYHNKQWASMMDDVGLCPSHTGEPGGKRTGDQMTHYIVKDGWFDVATRKLIAGGFSITWIDRVFEPVASGSRSRSRKKKRKGQDPDSSTIEPLPVSKRTRHKYSCPSCGLNAWAKPGISLTCTTCKKELAVAE